MMSDKIVLSDLLAGGRETGIIIPPFTILDGRNPRWQRRRGRTPGQVSPRWTAQIIIAKISILAIINKMEKF
jgi:hypothetical protein